MRTGCVRARRKAPPPPTSPPPHGVSPCLGAPSRRRVLGRLPSWLAVRGHCPLLACACSFGRWQRSRVKAKSEYTHTGVPLIGGTPCLRVRSARCAFRNFQRRWPIAQRSALRSALRCSLGSVPMAMASITPFRLRWSMVVVVLIRLPSMRVRASLLLVGLVARVRPHIACASALCFAASVVCPAAQPASGLLF